MLLTHHPPSDAALLSVVVVALQLLTTVAAWTSMAGCRAWAMEHKTDLSHRDCSSALSAVTRRSSARRHPPPHRVRSGRPAAPHAGAPAAALAHACSHCLAAARRARRIDLRLPLTSEWLIGTHNNGPPSSARTAAMPASCWSSAGGSSSDWSTNKLGRRAGAGPPTTAWTVSYGHRQPRQLHRPRPVRLDETNPLIEYDVVRKSPQKPPKSAPPR